MFEKYPIWNDDAALNPNFLLGNAYLPPNCHELILVCAIHFIADSMEIEGVESS